jgi:hypothetical protein
MLGHLDDVSPLGESTERLEGGGLLVFGVLREQGHSDALEQSQRRDVAAEDGGGNIGRKRRQKVEVNTE